MKRIIYSLLASLALFSPLLAQVSQGPVSIGQLDPRYVNTSGDTMTGPLAVASSITAQGGFYGSGAGITGLVGVGDAVLAASQTWTGVNTMIKPFTIAGSTLTVSGNAFSVGGSTLVVTGGKVGIGTTTPSTALHVVGSMTATAATIGGVMSISSVNGSASIVMSTNPGMGAGTGIITTSGSETIVRYNDPGTFIVPVGVTSLKVLVVGGGAGGDGGVTSGVYGHGGGGGRVTYRSAFAVTSGASYTVTVGTGGIAGPMDGQALPGVQSSFDTIIAMGGTKANNIGTGGDGGDSGNDINTVITNYNGLTDSTWGGAGGAGAGGVGGAVTDAAGGTGGEGYSSSITGSAIAYGAGGAGAGTGTGVPAVVAANLGLGGPGHGTSPGNGGSGIVIVRFVTAYDTLTVNDKFRIHNSGKLSIGSTTANNSLTIANPGVNGVAIDLRSDDTNLNGNAFSLARLLADFTSTSYADSRLYLQTATGDNAWKTGITVKDGNVGIGTVSPITTLHVVGSATVTGAATFRSSVTVTGSVLSIGDGVTAEAVTIKLDAPAENWMGNSLYKAGGTERWFIGMGDNATHGDKLLFRRTASSNDLVIDTAGKIGIGTSSPVTKLQVGIGNTSADTAIAKFNTADTNVAALELSNWDGAAATYGPRIQFDNSGVGTWYIGSSDAANNFDIAATWGTPLMRLTSAGNLGVGTVSPATKLHLSSGVITVDGAGAGITTTGNITGGSFTDPTSCPTGMAYIPGPYPYCVDKYEAYLVSGVVSNGTCINGSQAEVDANNTTAVAGSATGQTPLVNINWCAAKKACQNAGKHLLSNSEWFNAANYKGSKWDITAEQTAETMACNTASNCGGAACTSGASTTCVTQEGVFDMIGNVGEWVDFVMTADPTNGVAGNYVTGYDFATGIPTASGATSNPYGNDYYWAYNGTGVARAVVRGGSWDYGASAGVFAFDASSAPSLWYVANGFRCGRRK